MSNPHNTVRVNLSGVNCKSYAQWCVDLKMPIMVSPPQLVKSLLPIIANTDGLMVDSGAFGTKAPTREKLCKIICTYDQLDCEWVSLDVLWDQVTSDENYTFIRSVVPSETRLLWTYQPDAHIDRLKQGIDTHGRVGIGGIAKMSTGKRINYIHRVGDVLAKKGGTAHFFGVTDRDALRLFSAEKWFESVDSKRWVQAAFNGLILCDHGKSIKSNKFKFDFTKEMVAKQNAKQIQSWCVPVGMHQKKVAKKGKSKKHVQLTLVCVER